MRRLTRASSKALRSKRAWNVPPRSASLRSRRRHADDFVRFQAVVGVIDVRLFGVQFWVLLGQTFPVDVERRNRGSDMLAGRIADRTAARR